MTLARASRSPNTIATSDSSGATPDGDRGRRLVGARHLVVTRPPRRGCRGGPSGLSEHGLPWLARFQSDDVLREFATRGSRAMGMRPAARIDIALCPAGRCARATRRSSYSESIGTTSTRPGHRLYSEHFLRAEGSSTSWTADAYARAPCSSRPSSGTAPRSARSTRRRRSARGDGEPLQWRQMQPAAEQRAGHLSSNRASSNPLDDDMRRPRSASVRTASLARPPVAPAVDVPAWILAEVGRADDESSRPSGPPRSLATCRAKSAPRPFLDLDDLVVDLHPPSPRTTTYTSPA